MARIEMSCKGYTREYDVGEGTTIGRGESCGVKVPSTKASREHCKIFKSTGGFFIEDLGSANGTILNGVLVGRKLLKHNDEIIVGRIKLRFIDKTEDILIGKRLGIYQVIEKIGGGAEGVVYRGRQVAINKDVAIKVLSNDLIKCKGGVDKVRQCIDKAQKIEHPNIAKLYEFFVDKGRCFYSMELINGENLLDKTIRKKRIKVADAVRYGLSICSALEALHSFGVLHGDVKPQNILIDDNDNLKLIDLGWIDIEYEELESKSVHDEDTETDSEGTNSNDKKVFATPQYVAPELINHKPRREQSDVYAMSVTLYQMLTGKLPYKADRIEELLKQHVIGEVKNPCELNSRIPAELGMLVLRGMEADLEKRVKDASEYYRELLEISDLLKKKRAKNKDRKVKRLRKKRFGKIRIGPVYKILAVLVILLTLGSYGVREYKKYTLEEERRVEEELALGIELYKNGDYEKSENKIRGLLKENPASQVSTEARRILSLLELSDSIKELQTLKKNLQSEDVTKSEAVGILHAKLRSNKLNSEEEKEYLAYLKSIGGDTDVRYEWQKKIDEELGRKELLKAYDLISGLKLDTADIYERSLVKDYSTNIGKELDAVISEEYQRAEALLKSGRVVDASKLLNKIVNAYPESLGWKSRILDYFANSNEEVAKRFVEAFISSLDEIAKMNEVGVREVVFQFDEFTKNQISEIDTSSIDEIPLYSEMFYKAFVERIKTANSPNSQKKSVVEADINGAREFVELDFEGDKLIGYAQESKIGIDMVDILPSSLEKLLPIFEISTGEAVGAGLYFFARGSEGIGKGYFESLAGSGDSGSAASVVKYLELLNGRVELSINQSSEIAGIISGSSFKLGGSSIYFPVNSGEYRFARAEGGELILRVGSSELAIVTNVGGVEEVIGSAVIMAQEGGRIEIKGYWDKLLVSQNEVVVGQVERKAIGSVVIAPIKGERIEELLIIKEIPVKKREDVEKESEEEVLG